MSRRGKTRKRKRRQARKAKQAVGVRIVCDSTNNSQDDIDNGVIRVDITYRPEGDQ